MKLLNSSIIALCIIACSSAEPSTVNSADRKVAEKTFSNGIEDHVLYLFFTAEKSENGEISIVLDKKSVTKGKLKSSWTGERSNTADGNFIVSVLDSKNVVIESQVVENPFNPRREVYGEQMETVYLNLNKAEFFTRFSYYDSMKTIRIERQTGNEKKILTTIKL